MRILCLGDLHYRATTPSGRKDDYVRAHAAKMEQVLQIASRYGCKYILQPGDLFDEATVPYWVTREVIRMYRGQDWQMLVCLGQHDQRYHQSDRTNTPLGVLEAAGVVRVLGKMPYIDGDTLFYGASWGENVPVLKGKGEAVRILVTHRMVIKDKKLWPGQEDYAKAGALLRRHQYDLIVTGDNHNAFVERTDNRWLVNCGSLMRANVDQADHYPIVHIYDTETRHVVESQPLEIAPAAEVLKAEESAAARQTSAELEAFVEQIGRNRGAPDLDFLGNLNKLAKAEGVVRGVQDKIGEIVQMSSPEGG